MEPMKSSIFHMIINWLVSANINPNDIHSSSLSSTVNGMQKSFAVNAKYCAECQTEWGIISL